MKPLLVVDSAALSWATMSQEQRKGVCKVGITEHDKNDGEGWTEAGRENRNNENTPVIPSKYPPRTTYAPGFPCSSLRRICLPQGW